ncbi:MAG: hypothetical protein E5X86_19900 [Mesorhizobium sp.]|uniref:hypothetical protein n=1 Tax=Mesorhizobium sp. TaxID=1871066 RepID=UPI0012100BAF|nr:hypothetical protein [Mesorhizobium sp.]TIO15635.1 MAG: hypothetical protein E5X86_19900 [Mesorhizobium sp.]
MPLPWEEYQQQRVPWADFKRPAQPPAEPDPARFGYDPSTAKTGRLGKPDVATDVAASGASGLARGAADLLGLPGTIGDAVNAGGQWALRKGYQAVTGNAPEPGTFFGGPTPEIEAMMIGGGSNPLGGENLKAGLAKITGGASDYQPQTTAGEYARTVGEFAPAAVTGPGGLIRKAAMATVPAVMSETAGQATEGTALEPWARAGGALAGGFATAGRVNPVKEAAKGAPTREALKQTTDDFYTTLRNQGIKYDSNAWGATAQSAMDALLKAGFRPGMSDEITNAFRTVEGMIKQGSHSLDFDDINGLVQRVGGLARESSPQGAEAFNIIRDKLDDFERAAPLMTTTGMPQAALNETRTAARQTALKNIKARTLDTIVQNADTYQSGVEAGIRNGIGNLLRSKKGQQLFSGPERTALLQVAQGRKGLRTLSRFGFDLSKLSGNASFLPTVGALGAGAMLDPLAGGALLVAGTAAKAASPRLTQRAFDQTSAAIRSGNLRGATGQELTKRLRDEQTLRRLMAGQMGLQGSQAR